MSRQNQASQFVFFERVYPSMLVLSTSVLLTPAVALVVLPFLSTLVAVLVGAFCSVTLATLMLTSAPVIAIYDAAHGRMLKVGKARIALKDLGVASLVTPAQRRAALGTGLHALAYLRIQAGVAQLVRVEVADSSDKTPYWLFSTRAPTQLVGLLNA